MARRGTARCGIGLEFVAGGWQPPGFEAQASTRGWVRPGSVRRGFGRSWRGMVRLGVAPHGEASAGTGHGKARSGEARQGSVKAWAAENPQQLGCWGFSLYPWEMGDIGSYKQSCGTGIRTQDFRVMSPTRYPCVIPQVFTLAWKV